MTNVWKLKEKFLEILKVKTMRNFKNTVDSRLSELIGTGSNSDNEKFGYYGVLLKNLVFSIC